MAGSVSGSVAMIKMEKKQMSNKNTNEILLKKYHSSRQALIEIASLAEGALSLLEADDKTQDMFSADEIMGTIIEDNHNKTNQE